MTKHHSVAERREIQNYKKKCKKEQTDQQTNKPTYTTHWSRTKTYKLTNKTPLKMTHTICWSWIKTYELDNQTLLKVTYTICRLRIKTYKFSNQTSLKLGKAANSYRQEIEDKMAANSNNTNKYAVFSNITYIDEIKNYIETTD